MGDKGYQTPEGRCIISEEVIATIASTAAVEVPGVAGMAPRIKDLRGLVGNAATKSVAVVNNESETIVDLYINLKAGVRIPEVAGQVQRVVKDEVQSMTGRPVTKVNVHIAGIVLEEKKQTEKTEKAE
ncbi:MAG: Asp23/Gls24 family envelope stress response protein [Clostridia bacterium]|nr:Asp23/Gls24 family envelope stress response protein [Clostridia bacterium]